MSNEQIKAIGQDGTVYYLPKQSLDIPKSDIIARLAGIGGILIGLGATAGLIFEAIKSDSKIDQSELEATVRAVQTQQYVDEYGICGNENVLRYATGGGAIDMEGCATEHASWAERDIMATPTPNSIDNIGGLQ